VEEEVSLDVVETPTMMGHPHHLITKLKTFKKFYRYCKALLLCLLREAADSHGAGAEHKCDCL
jgi:hypothetical protein